MRLTLDQARSLGLIERLNADDRRCIDQMMDVASLPVASSNPSIKRRSKKPDSFNPQQMLFEKLKTIYPNVQSEVTGLIPGRRFRADIYFPEQKLVIEVDGFEEHAHFKENFHRTLERQNLFVLHGYKVLRYYTAQITQNMEHVLEQVEKMVEKT